MGTYSASGRGTQKGLNYLKLGCAWDTWFFSPISRHICRGMLGDPKSSTKIGGRLRRFPAEGLHFRQHLLIFQVSGEKSRFSRNGAGMTGMGCSLASGRLRLETRSALKGLAQKAQVSFPTDHLQKVRWEGWSKCRYHKGCTPSCWKGRGSFATALTNWVQDGFTQLYDQEALRMASAMTSLHGKGVNLGTSTESPLELICSSRVQKNQRNPSWFKRYSHGQGR